MIYRKGELLPASIDRGWPHQVALPAICSRGHSVFHEDKWFNVYCFAEPADAAKVMLRFGGEKFDPKQRGRGSNWARWKK
jgi:hypothetical protein